MVCPQVKTWAFPWLSQAPEKNLEKNPNFFRGNFHRMQTSAVNCSTAFCPFHGVGEYKQLPHFLILNSCFFFMNSWRNKCGNKMRKCKINFPCKIFLFPPLKAKKFCFRGKFSNQQKQTHRGKKCCLKTKYKNSLNSPYDFPLGIFHIIPNRCNPLSSMSRLSSN